MPLKALNSDGLEAISYELAPANYRQDWHCPHCQDPMSFVNANTRIKHFRHLVDRQCDVEPESEEHLILKRKMFDIFAQHHFTCKYEVRVGDGIADVLATGTNHTYAIECQVSSISPDKVLARNENYDKSNVGYFWVLHPENYLNTVGDREYLFRLKLIERAFMDEPWLLYYNPDSEWPEHIYLKPKYSKGGYWSEPGYCKTIFLIRYRKALQFK